MKRRVICKITGVKYNLGKDYYNKKVSEYSDEETLQTFFITKKAKTYLYKGYSVQEIRNILNVNDDELLGSNTPEMKAVVAYHVQKNAAMARRTTKTLNFAKLKSDAQVTTLINNIKAL